MSIIFTIYAKKGGIANLLAEFLAAIEGIQVIFLVSLPFYQNGQLNY